MLLPRIIPCLLLSGKGLVKGVKFKDHTYVGDPINTVQIFNTKEADEILFLDIAATREKRIPPLDLIQRIANQCLMPFGIGGGITTVKQIKEILSTGAEKVCICTAAIENPLLVKEASRVFGNQSIIVSIDVKRGFWGKYEIYKKNGTLGTGIDPIEHARYMESMGAGELLINSIDRDGTMQGYDLDLLQKITTAVNIPVIACGGAGSLEDLSSAIHSGGCSAAAAGSLFVFHGKRRAVLINYPSKLEQEHIRGND
jgi:cyclase